MWHVFNFDQYVIKGKSGAFYEDGITSVFVVLLLPFNNYFPRTLSKFETLEFILNDAVVTWDKHDLIYPNLRSDDLHIKYSDQMNNSTSRMFAWPFVRLLDAIPSTVVTGCLDLLSVGANSNSKSSPSVACL